MSEGESTLDILLDAYREGCQNYARDLENFTESLYAFCDELVRPALPDDWRQRLDVFLAEQEPKGYRVLPEHLPPLLEWIPTLEQYCHRQRADLHRAFMASETAQSGPTITIELPPGYPTSEHLAAARERDARIRAERHAMYEERNRQVLEAGRALGPPPRPPEEPPRTRETFFNNKLARAQDSLNKIERLLESLGNKLDAAGLGQQVDVETEVDAIAELIWGYNDAMESAREAWLREDLSGDALKRLNRMPSPFSFGLPAFTDQIQADRAQKQLSEINHRNGQRDVTFGRVIFGMQVLETAGDVAGIWLGGGAVVTAAKKGGKWAVVKTVAGMIAEEAAGEVVDRLAASAGVSEQTVQGVQLAVEVVSFILHRRRRRRRNAEPVARAAPDEPHGRGKSDADAGGGKRQSARGRGKSKPRAKSKQSRKKPRKSGSPQEHHAISKKVHNALEDHGNLHGKYRHRDKRFRTHAADYDSHHGYQEWHRRLDEEVANWIKKHEDATQSEFEAWLLERYNQPDLKARFPDGF